MITLTYPGTSEAVKPGGTADPFFLSVLARGSRNTGPNVPLLNAVFCIYTVWKSLLLTCCPVSENQADDTSGGGKRPKRVADPAGLSGATETNENEIIMLAVSCGDDKSR